MQTNSPKKINVFKFLWSYIWTNQTAKQKCKFIIFGLSTILTTIVMVSVPVLLKYAITVLETDQKLFGLTPIVIVVIYALMWMSTKIIDRLRHQASFPMIANIIHKLCLDLFAHLQKLPLRFHHDRKSGKVFNTISRTRYAIAYFTGALSQVVIPLMLHIILASMVLTYFFGIQYGIVLILMLFFYSTVTITTSENIIKCRQNQNKCDGEANAYIVDSILNAETVKYFETSEYEINQALVMLKKKEVADVAGLMADAKIHLLQNTVIGLAVIILTIMSGFDVFHQKLHLSDFVMVNGFILMFMQPLSELGYFYRQAKQSFAQLESAIDLFQQPIEIQDSFHAKPLEFKKGEIKFEKVTFGYNENRIILKDLSFTVPAGTTTAIVGESGSGKSTISRLLFRLYDIENGSISIDNQDIKNITRLSLCQTIGIVPQDTVLFNDTLLNNICYANHTVSNQELTNILQSAKLDAFVNQLPNKLNTIIGERGLKLSGGERQRVSIARMLARKPNIMVFDEATSALDLNTEKEIQQCLDNIAKYNTTIIIAHRLSTIRYADNIIVLDNGKIVEQGTHEELIIKNGAYNKLLSKQEENS